MREKRKRKTDVQLFSREPLAVADRPAPGVPGRCPPADDEQLDVVAGARPEHPGRPGAQLGGDEPPPVGAPLELRAGAVRARPGQPGVGRLAEARAEESPLLHQLARRGSARLGLVHLHRCVTLVTPVTLVTRPTPVTEFIQLSNIRIQYV